MTPFVARPAGPRRRSTSRARVTVAGPGRTGHTRRGAVVRPIQIEVNVPCSATFDQNSGLRPCTSYAVSRLGHCGSSRTRSTRRVLTNTRADWSRCRVSMKISCAARSAPGSSASRL
ncbi:hypothetical protein J3R04_004443 [Spirilliplanes yamanashiensis]|nr:hypothetical protein [Spirilliplanes yamanashiensis]